MMAEITVSSLNVTEGFFPDMSSSEIEAAQQYTRYKIARWLDAYSTYILAALALVGNSVALVTICSMRPRTSTSIYIATLAVVDTLCLVCKLLTVHLVRHPAIPEEIACGLILSVFFMAQYAASWLIVIISVERFVAVWFPIKVSLMSTKRKAIIILSSMFIICVPMSFWAFWFYTRWYIDHWGYICTNRARYDSAMNIIKKIHPIIYILLPFVLILCLNILIIVGVRRANQLRQLVNATEERRPVSRRIDKRLTVMLLTTALVFLLLETMMVVLTLFRHYSRTGTEPFVEDLFFVELAQTLEDTNHAVNFFLYFCSGAKFRETLLNFCRKKTFLRHQNSSSRTSRISSYKVQPSTSVDDIQLKETPRWE